RTDFIISEKGPIYLETNTLPGLTKASLYPKALKARGIDFADFLRDQIVLAERRAQRERRLKPHVCGRANQFVTELLTLPAKAFIWHVKTRPAQTSFTLCLPGSP